MYQHEIIESVLQNLHVVASETSVALRKAALCQYVNRISTPKELDLLTLILSFQVAEITPPVRPKFNTITFGSLTSALRAWFDTYDQLHTPYIVQSVLYFMSSTKTIGLSVGHVAECIEEYIDPYEWLARNQIVLNMEKDTQLCKLCNINTTTNDLCQECITNLSAFTEYRCTDFTLTISNVTCPWLIDTYLGSELFSFTYGGYIIERVGIISIAFTRVTNIDGPTQGQLPFKEYQKRVN